ncbi:MAG TPA: pseudouridine synthase, partial [Kofleriaceae bacterium]|nr:pseudouridine synthase [Kofleriaceae bacterium]
MSTPVRLQRYLAAAGVAARRKAEDLITSGRVTVNGKPVTVLGTKVDPQHDAVAVDGEAVVALDHFYVLMNKPKGCITTVTDDRGRPTVMDYLPNLPAPVKPVGRLDFYSEGVLLLTNDGELAARLLAPASHVPKTYHVKIHGNLEPKHLKQLRDGVRLDDGTVTMPAEVEILPGESKHTWLGITIHEGKHRQIHRMVEALGFFVDKLQRVAFANLTFHGLRVGDARELTQQELNQLRDMVGLDHSAVARGRWRTTREDTDISRRARAKARAEAEEAAALRAGAPAAPHGGEADAYDPADDDERVDYDDSAEPRAGAWDDEVAVDDAAGVESGEEASRDGRTGRPGGARARTGGAAGRAAGSRDGGAGPRGGSSRGDGASRGGLGSRDAGGGSRDAGGGSRGGFGSRDARGGGSRTMRGGGSRDAGGGSRGGGFGSRDARGGGSRDAGGGSRDGYGSRAAGGGSRGGGFGSRDARGGGSRGG